MSTNIYIQLFISFVKIGAFTIGGGYAMIPMIEKEVVDKKKWLNRDDFVDLLAVAQSAPGVLAVNMAVFVGYRLRGPKGSVVAALANITPSFVIILAIALFFAQFNNNPMVVSIFKGIRPAVVALIAVPAVQTARKAGLTLRTFWVPIVVVLLITLVGISPVYIVAAIVAASLLYQLATRNQA